MTSQQALHQYAKHNDAEAFRLLVNQYQRLVYSAAARRLAAAHDIEDTVQLTFLKLARAAHTIRKDLAAWLYSTALNNANDLIRRDATRRRHEARAASPESFSPDLEQNQWHSLSALLDEALLQLPPDQQSLIIEHFFRSRTHAQLAADLRLSERTIIRHMKSAVAALREKLARHGQLTTDPLLASTLSALPQPPVPAPLTTQLTKIGLVGGAGNLRPSPQSGPLAAVIKFGSSARATKITLSIAGALLLTGTCIHYYKSLFPPATPAVTSTTTAPTTQATPSGPTPSDQTPIVTSIEFEGTSDSPFLTPLLKTKIGQPYSRANLDADLMTIASLDRYKSVRAQISPETPPSHTGTTVRFIVEEKSVTTVFEANPTTGQITATTRPVLPLTATPTPPPSKPIPQTQPNRPAQRPNSLENTPILSVEINLTPEEIATLSAKLQLRPGRPFSTDSLHADEATLAAANLPLANLNAVPSAQGVTLRIRLTRPTPTPPISLAAPTLPATP